MIGSSLPWAGRRGGRRRHPCRRAGRERGGRERGRLKNGEGRRLRLLTLASFPPPFPFQVEGKSLFTPACARRGGEHMLRPSHRPWKAVPCGGVGARRARRERKRGERERAAAAAAPLLSVREGAPAPGARLPHRLLRPGGSCKRLSRPIWWACVGSERRGGRASVGATAASERSLSPNQRPEQSASRAPAPALATVHAPFSHAQPPCHSLSTPSRLFHPSILNRVSFPVVKLA